MSKNKPRGLYSLLIQRMQGLEEYSIDGIIPFQRIFGKICPNFSISKDECWEVLFFLRDVGFIEIIPYTGIRIPKIVLKN